MTFGDPKIPILQGEIGILEVENSSPQAEIFVILRSKIQILQGRIARRRRKILAFGDPKIPILQGEIGILEVENSPPQAEFF